MPLLSAELHGEVPAAGKRTREPGGGPAAGSALRGRVPTPAPAGMGSVPRLGPKSAPSAALNITGGHSHPGPPPSPQPGRAGPGSRGRGGAGREARGRPRARPRSSGGSGAGADHAVRPDQHPDPHGEPGPGGHRGARTGRGRSAGGTGAEHRAPLLRQSPGLCCCCCCCWEGVEVVDEGLWG